MVAMTLRKAQPYGPPVLALDPPRSMLWGDADEPRRFTWLWLLRDDGQGRTRLISRVRCRLLVAPADDRPHDEFGDPIMMSKCLLGIAERAETAPQGQDASSTRGAQQRQREQEDA